MKGIRCKYCGRIYESPSVMRTKKCHSHPRGAWCGYCTPDSANEFFWGMERHFEEMHRNVEKIEQLRKKEEEEEAQLRIEYKKHTPLLDCLLKRIHEEGPSEYSLLFRNMDLNEFALEFANGINKRSRDAINTIYALRDSCDYVLNNADAQDEGSLHAWLDEIKRLKDDVIRWDFWVALYWLTKPITDDKIRDDKNYEKSICDGDYDAKMHYGAKVSFWINHSIAEVFHTKQTMPMLRVLRVLKKEADDEDRSAKNAITSNILRVLSSKSKSNGYEDLDKVIEDPAFWSSLYCLYWMKLRPTPWSDKKVWPLRVPSELAKELREAYSNNFAPFEKIHIQDKTTLVFDGYLDAISGKTAMLELSLLPDAVTATLFMRDGHLSDIQAFVNGSCQLKKLFPEINEERLQHSELSYDEVKEFIDSVLEEFRW